MKRFFLIATCVMVAGIVNAQQLKFGHLSGQEVIAQMPERDSAQSKFMAYAKDLEEQIELMQVEYNNKLNNYQKSVKGWSDAIREMKEKEIQDLGQRIQEFQATAQQDLQKRQDELLTPVIKKATEAIQKVGKDNGFIYIFDIGNPAFSYFDPSQSIDVSSLVKKELGIVDKTNFAPLKK